MERGAINVAALTAGVASLTTVLAAFTFSGEVGQVVRNEPLFFLAALVLVVLGGTALASAGLPMTTGSVEKTLAGAGLLLTTFGLMAAVIGGFRSAERRPGPTIAAAVDQSGLHVKGSVEIDRLDSDQGLVTAIDGLTYARNAEASTLYHATRLQRFEAGADGSGSIEDEVDIQLPPGHFDYVRVRSWTTDPESDVEPDTDHPLTCGFEDSTVPPNPREPTADAKRGCLVLPLRSIPISPRVRMDWLGKGASRKRLRVVVATSNAPVDRSTRSPKHVAVVVTGALRAKDRRQQSLYRGRLHTDGRGRLRAVLHVPVTGAYSRVCARASFGNVARTCSVHQVGSSEAAVELPIVDRR